MRPASPSPSGPARLAVRAVPNAPSDAVVGWIDGALKVKVHAPALDGRANEAVCETVARALGVRRREVRLLQGAASRQKLLAIDGLDHAEMLRRLNTPRPAAGRQ